MVISSKMKGNLVDDGNSEVVSNSKCVGNFQVVGSSKFALGTPNLWRRQNDWEHIS